MEITWWYWICLGLFFLLAEALTPGGFYLLFTGIAAVVVGVLALAFPMAWLQISLFAVLSAILIFTLRRPLVARVRKSTHLADKPEFIGEVARAVEPIGAGQVGKIELRGSIWKARNAGPTDLPGNAACTIIAREGLQLVFTVKP